MQEQKLFIKNMVCDRCKSVVRTELVKGNIQFGSVELGEVELIKTPTANQLETLKANLAKQGFELIEDKSARTVSQIKNTVIEFVRHPPESNSVFSDFLTDRLHKEYGVLSQLFSEIEGLTIEKYVILQRVERVKELLVYDESTVGEIADQLGYSSVQHLSNQFKKITGLTPTHFKKVGFQRRKSLDRV